ncbi:hypothetical protein ACMWQD_28570, partial [Escherichia coli]|uniref:hypothetical protein n=1 Tax=Escherichia coli TaxID=562 RepID=UPI0039E1BE2C
MAQFSYGNKISKMSNFKIPAVNSVSMIAPHDAILAGLCCKHHPDIVKKNDRPLMPSRCSAEREPSMHY